MNAVSFATQAFTLHRLGDAFFGLQGFVLMVAAWITLVFVVLEYAQPHFRSKVRFLDDWRPRDLPKPETPAVYNLRHKVAEVLVSGAALVWLLLLPHYPFLVSRYIVPVPGCKTFYWLFLLLLLAEWLIEVATIFVPRLRRVRPVLGMMGRAAIAVLFAFALRLPAFVMLTDAGRAARDVHSLADAVNTALRIGLRAVVAVIVVKLLVDIFHMLRAPRHASSYKAGAALL